MTGQIVHAVPRGDLVQHEVTETCVCGPTVEPVKREDGAVGWVAIHHSIDGREANE